MSSSITCKKKFCERYTKKRMDNLKIASKNLDKLMNITRRKQLEIVTNKIKDLERKTNKTEKEKEGLLELKKGLKVAIDIIKKQKKQKTTKKIERKMVEETKEQCARFYCNTPACKDTIMESSKKLPDNILKITKGKPHLVSFFKKMHKDIFKNKKTVVTDGFYDGLTKKEIEGLKKKGAISGCLEALTDKALDF